MRTRCTTYKINYLLLHWNYDPLILGQFRIVIERNSYGPCAMAVAQGPFLAAHNLLYFVSLHMRLLVKGLNICHFLLY